MGRRAMGRRAMGDGAMGDGAMGDGAMGDGAMGDVSFVLINNIRLKVLVAERCKIIAIPVLAKEVNVGCNSGHMPYICKVFTSKVGVRFYQS